jgi:PAS domain S-box-containing protein
MNDFRFSDLLDLAIIQKMAEAHYRAAGMPIGVIDANDGSILVGAGWQDICVKFHRANQLSLQRCRESDNYIKDHLVHGEACRYKCKNGLWDIGIPILVAGRHLATLFLGQFFYEGEVPDRAFFTRQAHEFDFNVSDYLATLDRVPVFSREKVEDILEYDKALAIFVADLAEHELFKINANEKIRESERKFHAVFDQSYQFIGLLSIDGRMLEVNRTALAFADLEAADVIGRPFWETPWWTHSPELQEKIRLAVQQAAKGELVRLEAFHPAADGSRHYVDVSLKPVKDEAGRVIMLMSEGRDITQRKQAEEERLVNLRFFEIMDRVNRAMQGTNDLKQVMNDVLEQMLSIFECDRAWLLYPCDPKAASWRVPMERTRPEYPGALENGVEVPMSPDVVNHMQTALATSGPVTFGPGGDQPLVGEAMKRFQYKSQMFMAVYPKVDSPWLIGMQQCSYPRVWTREEKILFQEIGRRMGDTLDSLLIYRDLRKSEAENRAIVNAVPDLLFRLHQDGTITDFRKPENMDLYLPPDQFIGRSITDVLPSNISQPAISAITKALTTKEVSPFEYDLIMKQQHRYFEGRVVALSNTEVLIVIRDITDRKRAEKALAESEAKTRGILDNISIGVALISPQMEILEQNRRMHEWFPAVDAGQHPICYQTFNHPPREEICAYCPTCKTLQDGLVHDSTTQILQPGGTRNYRVTSSPIFNQAGQVTAAIEMVEDITEKLSLESQLRQAQKMESVGRLAGGVAHDFNNMLGVIIGHAELALYKMDRSQPLFAAMQEIHKAALRSADLTQQLLAFARKQTVAPTVLDLNETVEGMLKMLRRIIGEDIDLVWLPDSDVCPVKMDTAQIDQILANLCINARDAIAGVGKVTIETHAVSFDEDYCTDRLGFRPGDFVMLAVSDNGQGMDRETIDKIFEPFFTTKGVGKGTGLGLSTVYGIVKQNDGFINAYSEPGQGSTFRIYLPRHAAESRQMHEERPVSPDPHGHDTILLVEDEAAILEITQLILENLGYRVLTASTAGEALAVASEHAGEISLVITDVVMPNMSGRDLAKELIARYPGLRTLFMSGYTDNAIAHHGVLDEGINFIQKPFSKQALAAKVREVLDS